MSEPTTIELYFRDLVTLLKERARAAKAESRDVPDNRFKSGWVMGYYEVFSLMRNQAIAFQIDLKDLNLDDLDPDKELLF